MSSDVERAQPDESTTEAWVEALNQQAQRCTEEIARRSTTQQALEAATISASAALAGIVVTGNSSALLLLLVPVVASVFAHQWLDHHRTIGRIGGYLADHLEPQLKHRLNHVATGGFEFWETHVRRTGADAFSSGPRRHWWGDARLWWAGPIMLLFAGVSLVVLAVLVRVVWLDPQSAATHGLGSGGIEVWPRLVWTADVGLVGWLVVALWRELMAAPPRETVEGSVRDGA